MPSSGLCQKSRALSNVSEGHPINEGNYFEKHKIKSVFGSARGVMVIVAGNGHGDTSSNPGRDWLHFT